MKELIKKIKKEYIWYRIAKLEWKTNPLFNDWCDRKAELRECLDKLSNEKNAALRKHYAFEARVKELYMMEAKRKYDFIRYKINVYHTKLDKLKV